MPCRLRRCNHILRAPEPRVNGLWRPTSAMRATGSSPQGRRPFGHRLRASEYVDGPSLPTMLLEHGADWLDAPDQAGISAVFVTVDEGDCYVSGRSISPREYTGSSLEDLIGAPQFSILAHEAINF